MELQEEFFSLDPSCVLFLYQTNFNGTRRYRDALIRANVVDVSSAAVNLIFWSYPCREGSWSADGIEHGTTDAYKDRNGIAIDDNDELCDDDTTDDTRPDCAAPCQTCAFRSPDVS